MNDGTKEFDAKRDDATAATAPSGAGSKGSKRVHDADGFEVAKRQRSSANLLMESCVVSETTSPPEERPFPFIPPKRLWCEHAPVADGFIGLTKQTTDQFRAVINAGSADKTNLKFPVLEGASGVGKTRCGWELIALLQQYCGRLNARALRTFMSFAEDETKGEASVDRGWTILRNLAVQHLHQTATHARPSVDDFASISNAQFIHIFAELATRTTNASSSSSAASSATTASSSATAAAVSSATAAGAVSSATPYFCWLIQTDEFQKNVQATKDLLQAVTEINFRSTLYGRVLILPVLTGTSSIGVPGSWKFDCSPVFSSMQVTLPPQADDSERFLQTMIATLQPPAPAVPVTSGGATVATTAAAAAPAPIELSSQLQRLARVIGGWPRAFQLLRASIWDVSGDTTLTGGSIAASLRASQWTEIWNRFRQKITAMYGGQKILELYGCKRAVAMCVILALSGVPVFGNCRINGINLEEAQRLGVLTLVPSKVAKKVAVEMTPLLIGLLNDWLPYRMRVFDSSVLDPFSNGWAVMEVVALHSLRARIIGFRVAYALNLASHTEEKAKEAARAAAATASSTAAATAIAAPAAPGLFTPDEEESITHWGADCIVRVSELREDALMSAEVGSLKLVLTESLQDAIETAAREYGTELNPLTSPIQIQGVITNRLALPLSPGRIVRTCDNQGKADGFATFKSDTGKSVVYVSSSKRKQYVRETGEESEAKVTKAQVSAISVFANGLLTGDAKTSFPVHTVVAELVSDKPLNVGEPSIWTGEMPNLVVIHQGCLSAFGPVFAKIIAPTTHALSESVATATAATAFQRYFVKK